jgi:hypothetical protein
MSAPATEARAYQQYLAEANAEIDAMLAPASTPEPVPEVATPPNPLLKAVIVALVAVAVFVLGMILFRGRGPVRSMA